MAGGDNTVEEWFGGKANNSATLKNRNMLILEIIKYVKFQLLELT